MKDFWFWQQKKKFFLTTIRKRFYLFVPMVYVANSGLLCNNYQPRIGVPELKATNVCSLQLNIRRTGDGKGREGRWLIWKADCWNEKKLIDFFFFKVLLNEFCFPECENFLDVGLGGECASKQGVLKRESGSDSDLFHSPSEDSVIFSKVRFASVRASR